MRARKIRTQRLAFGLTVADEHRLLALPRLHPAIERRVYSRERSVRQAQHRLFSDRSACYLAAGRPVITQETGFTKNYGGDAGLLAFRSLGEIADAVKKINADYPKHSGAARQIARELFEAEKVLKSLLDRAGI